MTVLTEGACTRAGVCARRGRVLVVVGVRPEEEVDGGLGDTAGLGDRGRLLGGAGEETRLLGLILVLRIRSIKKKTSFTRNLSNLHLNDHLQLSVNYFN